MLPSGQLFARLEIQFAGGEQTYVTTYSEAGGSYIGKTFWVEITWEDAEGSHRIESAAAECTI